jgi:hypothetical protein
MVGRGAGGSHHACLEGSNLYADVWVAANNRARLERLCRYVLKPPHRVRAGGPAHRRPHWKVTVLVPFGLVTMLEVIGCEPYLRQ